MRKGDWVAQVAELQALGGPHPLILVRCFPQEASSRNLVTLRVDPNGFFLYWTGPNMVRAGAPAALMGQGPPAPGHALPQGRGGTRPLADLSHGSPDRKC